MDGKQGLIIIGAGGHAKVVLSVAQSNSYEMIGYLDDNPALINQSINRYPVLGDTSILTKQTANAVFGLGDNSKRKILADQNARFQNWQTLIHPHAYVHPSAKLGKGTVVFAGAIIQPDVVIGDHCIINTGVTVDHDCVLSHYVHLAPGVHLAGNVHIGEGAFLGIGSVVIPGMQIGEWTQVAAGGVVVHSIAARKKVMGIPAKERA
jgi:sugar O-acyltransferase (sialic acid O-acetyltransferase NeuD family)